MKFLSIVIALVMTISFSAVAQTPNTAFVVTSPKMKMHKHKSPTVSNRLVPLQVGQQVTAINPMVRSDIDNDMDINHSILKAKRYYRNRMGVTTEQLAAYTNRLLAQSKPAKRDNQAVIIRLAKKQHVEKAVNVKLKKSPAPKRSEILVQQKNINTQG